jgi:hypothetical protein
MRAVEQVHSQVADIVTIRAIPSRTQTRPWRILVPSKETR